MLKISKIQSTNGIKSGGNNNNYYNGLKIKVR
jgi:hypothetical protein